MFPDFLCIGAQKAGTTWLHHNLSQQPAIWLPPVKEIHFLDHEPPSLTRRLFDHASHHRLPRQHFRESLAGFLRRKEEFASLAYACRLAFARRDWDWYESLFPAKRGLLTGEICPGYARLSPKVIEAVTKRNPKLKIVYLLRDPIDRAWSSVAMHFRKIEGSTIGVTEHQEILRQLKGNKFLSHCRYDSNIANWQQFVAPDRMYFGFFERIAAEPANYLADILAFLGIDRPPAAAKPEDRVNAGRGETIDLATERELASMLIDEAACVDARFGNVYTAAWLEHARGALG